ncbi:hypothetical protein CERZMDRAFT_84136 [Cercospora zeae-maydis SCOH1-5]|uniref:Uncharacterized protein n=1 Tax=Cercospora zeae-maydis SCOH1-5 TaxID=717836 RepID=A0A6A6FIN1_9PEZI|nr:hypothetical protein CERZMDRAFT_84136 [Cercospora zeae-maydis SCOH1-5]
MSMPQHQATDDTPAESSSSAAASFIFEKDYQGESSEGRCLVQVTFSSDDSSLAPWTALSFLIPLTADMYALSDEVKEVCEYAISANWQDFEALDAQGMDMEGAARISMSDGLDIYMNRTPSGRIRIESVSDLFTNAELKEGKCVVSVHVALSTIEHPLHATSDRTGPPENKHARGVSFQFKRSQDLAAESTHSKMEYVVLEPLSRYRVGYKPMPGMLAREINSLSIGSIDDAVPYTGDEDLEGSSPPKTCNGGRLPELPPLTFNNYSPLNNAGVSQFLKQQGGRIELAVRLVNRLAPPFSGPVPTDMRLPGDVIVSVKHVDKQYKHICNALQSALRAYGAKPENVTSLARVMFHENFEPDWEMHLWILPQAAQPKKLFRFPGGLANYMDTTMVSEGNLKMYMEAHIVPKHEEEIPPAPERMAMSAERLRHIVNEMESTKGSAGCDAERRSEIEVMQKYAKALLGRIEGNDDTGDGEGDEEGDEEGNETNEESDVDEE